MNFKMLSPTALNLHFQSPPSLVATDKDSGSSLPKRRGILTRILAHPKLMPYNRWAVLMFAINVLIYLSLKNQSEGVVSSFLRDATLTNFAVAILIRQQLVVNFLFSLATRAPTSWPLSIRAALAKVYHFGGIHVGCFFSGSLWLALSTQHLFQNSLSQQFVFLKSVLCVHLFVLLIMMLTALPPFRARTHNIFEISARFGGWISLALFWIQSLQMHPLSGAQLALLALVTLSVASPWFRLRRVSVKWVRPSNHATLAKFDYGVTPFAGSSTELSRNPLFEWHSFANVPTPGQEGFRLTIARAGDWTGQLIDNQPEKLWVKGIPTAGVGNIETLFKKVIWVATGSGIGPCLPHLFQNKVPSRLVWSTKNPVRTFGEDLVHEISQAQPEALIWDTDQQGKPDLVELAYQAYREFGAEAIICIANKKVTWNVVQEFQSRGIPAFGAIWDS